MTHNPLTPIGIEPDDALDAAVPEHLRAGLARYVQHGIQPGSLLCAIIENDLAQATARRGGDLTERDVAAVIDWLRWRAPADCFGNERIRKRWQAQGGMAGRGQAVA